MTDSAPTLRIERIYIADCSLENPNAPESFLYQEEPTVNVSVNPSHRKLNDDLYEVSVNVNVTAAIKKTKKTMFICEVTQKGAFFMQNIPAEHHEILLNVTLPNTLFPYARRAVDSLIVDAGFPPMHLPPADFEAFYREKMAKEKDSAPVQ